MITVTYVYTSDSDPYAVYVDGELLVSSCDLFELLDALSGVGEYTLERMLVSCEWCFENDFPELLEDISL